MVFFGHNILCCIFTDVKSEEKWIMNIYNLTASSRIHWVNEIYRLLMLLFSYLHFCTSNGVTFCLCRSTRSCSKSIELTNQTFYQTLFIYVSIQFRAIRLFEGMCFFSTRMFCKAKYMNIIKRTSILALKDYFIILLLWIMNYIFTHQIQQTFYFVSNCI